MLAMLCAACDQAPAPKRAVTAAPEVVPATVAATAPASVRASPNRRIVMLGDSLTAGQGLEAEHAYPALLKARLDARGTGFQVVNAGVSGDTSAGGLRRLDWALDGGAAVVLVALGGNDALRGLPVKDLAANLDEIVRRAKATGARVILAGMEAPPNTGPDYVASFRAVYPAIAKKHGVTLVPFLLDGVAGMETLNQADGIHPNPKGARIVADTVWRALEPVVRELGAPCAMITLRGVSKTVRSGDHPLTILHPLDLTVPDGQFLAIVGPSGSGKTTLLGLMAGLDAPTSGTIEVGGAEITALDEDRLAVLRGARIGFVFQFFHLVPSLTALENVLVPMELVGRKGARERATALLAEVGLFERAHHYPTQLSGGEQQRVAIARALANDPPLILADEPTGNLDGQNGRHILDLLLSVRAARKVTLVLVTHDAEIAGLADANLTLRDGRPVPELTTADLGSAR